MRRNFPHLKVFAASSSRLHFLRLQALGAHVVIRRSFFSSLEMTRRLLRSLGLPEDEAQDTVERFRAHDEKVLERQRAVMHDEKQMIQTARDAAQELEQLFDADREGGRKAS